MIRISLIALFFIACGSTMQIVPEILPPNVKQACDRAIRCGVFMSVQRSECIACLNHIDMNVLNDLREQYGDLPPLDTVDCDTIDSICRKATNVASCVVGRWYGP